MTNNTFTLALTSGALDDLNKTVLWYDKKVSGLGERFLLKSRLSIANIRQFPQAYSFYKKRSVVRRAAIHGFPYFIYFTIVKDHVEVLAVVHAKRSKSTLRKKLK